jgi:tetratricopeptide (TPR) repeat protein
MDDPRRRYDGDHEPSHPASANRSLPPFARTADVDLGPPLDVEGWYEQGIRALQRHDWSVADTIFRRVLDAVPDYRDAAARLAEAQRMEEITRDLSAAQAALDAERYEEAIALFEKLCARAPEIPEFRALLDTAGRLQSERAVLDQQVKQSPLPLAEPPVVGTGLHGTAPSVRKPVQFGPPPDPALAPSAPPRDEAARAAAQPAATHPRPYEALEPTPIPATTAVVASPRRKARPYGPLAIGAGLLALLLVAALGLRNSGGYATRPAPTQEIAGRTVEAKQSAPVDAVAPAVDLPGAPVQARAVSDVPAATGGAELFGACESAVAAADWDAAVGACEQVRDADPGYPGLATALAATYLHLGEAEMENGAPAAGLELFDAALAYEPDNAVAAEQRELARSYLEGEAAARG